MRADGHPVLEGNGEPRRYPGIVVVVKDGSGPVVAVVEEAVYAPY